jgi:hypothetical protein
LLNEQVLLLSKKHGQLKQAITKMVQVVMGFLDDTPNMETKLSVIETLRNVTEGKVSAGSIREAWQVLIYSRDLCGSRTGTNNPNTLQHQKISRRPSSGNRHPL